MLASMHGHEEWTTACAPVRADEEDENRDEEELEQREGVRLEDESFVPEYPCSQSSERLLRRDGTVRTSGPRSFNKIATDKTMT